ncbi:MAG: recombinase family protein [Candidatus Omnitrophica bacterium]|nr:recombinase family protein [Candidatus Omnitrophota bacterium]
MMRCGLYIRVSTDMQRERGESLDVQLKRLEAYVTSKEDWSVVAMYKDAGISAKNTNRPEFIRMMDDIEAGRLDVILCTKLDRLFRNTKDFLDTTENFERKNVMFVCLEGNIDTSTPAGRVFSTMRAAFSQFERETTAERVKDVMCSRAEQGKYNGGIAPYGFLSENKSLRVNSLEADIVREIFSFYLEHRSILYVTHKLNEDGIKTRKGGMWAPTSVRRILTNPCYYGEVVYNKRSHTYRGELRHNPVERYIRGAGAHQPLITRELFDKVRDIVRQQSKIAPKANAKYLLTGLVYCSRCGVRMHGMLYTKPNGAKYAYYKCSGHTQKGNAQCSGSSIRADSLESLITGNLKNLSIDSNRVKKSLEETVISNDKGAEATREQVRVLQAQLDKAMAKRQRIFELYESGNITKSEFLERKQLVDVEEAGIAKRLGVLRDKPTSLDIDYYDIDSTIGLCQDMKEVFDELDMPDRKELLRNLLSEIKIDKHFVDYSIQIPPKIISRAQDSGLCVDSSDTGARADILPTRRRNATARRRRSNVTFLKSRARYWTG